MAQSKARTSRDDIGRGGHASWREASQNSSALILSLLKEAATTPLAELKEAACVALLILETIRVWTPEPPLVVLALILYTYRQ